MYDLFFPPEFRFLCNPDRPAVAGRFGLPADRLWRFEYIIHKGEDGYVMASPEEMRRVVYPYITHRGSRYQYVYLPIARRQWLTAQARWRRTVS